MVCSTSQVLAPSGESLQTLELGVGDPTEAVAGAGDKRSQQDPVITTVRIVIKGEDKL